MANFETLKTAIDANINTNGKQAITGSVVNNVMHQMVDATSEQLTELESKVHELNIFNLHQFLATQGASQFYNFTNGEIKVLELDNRVEKNISPILYLSAGVTYRIKANFVSTTSATLHLWLKSEVYYTFSIMDCPSFEVTESGFYVVKLFSMSSPQFSVCDFGIYKEEDWRLIKPKQIIPDFSIGNDAVAINRAIFASVIQKINKVYIPRGEYTLTDSIKIDSGVTLECSNEAMLTLGDNVSLPLIVNSLRTVATIVGNEYIEIYGGIWRGNSVNQEKYSVDADAPLSIIHMSGVSHVKIHDATIEDSRTYAILIGKCKDIEMYNLRVLNAHDEQDNQDGIHFLGDASEINIHDCYIQSTDNAIALNSTDVLHGTYTSSGDIKNVNIDNIIIDNNNNGQGIMLLSAETKIDNVHINNVKGRGRFLIAANHFNLAEGYVGTYTNVTISNVAFEWDKYPDSYNCISLAGTFKNLKICNLDVLNVSNISGIAFSNNALIYMNKASGGENYYENLTLSNIKYSTKYDIGRSQIIYMRFVRGTNVVIDGVYNDTFAREFCPILIEGCAIDNLSVSNMMIKSLTYLGWLRLEGQGKFGHIALSNCVTDGQSSKISVTGSNPIDKLSVSGCGDFSSIGIAKEEHYDGVRYNSELPNKNDIGYYIMGQTLVDRANNKIYLCKKSGSTFRNDWQPNTSYAEGDAVTFYLNVGYFVYECIKGGTSGTSFNPTFGEFSDNTITWRYLYLSGAEFSEL